MSPFGFEQRIGEPAQFVRRFVSLTDLKEAFSGAIGYSDELRIRTPAAPWGYAASLQLPDVAKLVVEVTLEVTEGEVLLALGNADLSVLSIQQNVAASAEVQRVILASEGDEKLLVRNGGNSGPSYCRLTRVSLLERMSEA